MDNLKQMLDTKSFASIVRIKDIDSQIDTYIKPLNFSQQLGLKEKIYIIKNNLTQPSLCKTCKNPVSFNERGNRYLAYCSPTCSSRNEEVIGKRKKTWMQKYGIDNPQKAKQVRNKTKQTCLERYGAENPLVLLKEQMGKSYKKRYGTEKTQQILDKRKNTCQNKYGVEYATQSVEIREKIKNTNQNKYGGNAPSCSATIQNKTQNTLQEKYGVKHIFQRKDIVAKNSQPYLERYGEKCEQVKQNRKNACLEKYGVSNPFASEQVKNKIHQTLQTKYNVDNPMKIFEVKEKSKQTCQNKYGVDNFSKTDEMKNLHKQRYYKQLFKLGSFIPQFSAEEYGGEQYKNYLWKCTKTGKYFQAWYANGLIPLCPCCHPQEGTDIENFIQSFLQKNNIEYRFRTRSVLDNNLELDFFIPSKNLAIEVHGLYWHSEKKILERGKNPRLYHLNKLENCLKKNIRLIQIFSDEIHKHPRIVQSRLKTILGLQTRSVFARKCIVQEIEKSKKSSFLSKYHIQGDDRSSICLGLFYKNRLISSMTFGKPRIVMGQKNVCAGNYELLRYCSLFHHNVVGGAGKLLEHFKRNYAWNRIITYADRRWSQGNMYQQLEFTFSHHSSPNYFYTRNYTSREYRYKYNKSALIRKYPELAEFSERCIMDSLGFDRVYDCGHSVFNLNPI